MKSFYFLLFLFCSVIAKGQTVASFSKTEDEIPAGPKEVVYKIKLVIPDAASFKGSKVTVKLVADKTTLSQDSIFMPVNSAIVIDKQTEGTIPITVKCDLKNDKQMVFELSAVDKDQNALDLKTSSKQLTVLVKPLSAQSLTKAENALFYTGTNVDLLDGVKPKDLYFRASYLLNFDVNKTPTRHWLYINAGKNRYVTATDSIARVGYSDLDISKYSKDSTYIKSGYYKSSYEEITDNIYLNLDYLYELLNSENKLFFVADMYVGYQAIKTTYKNTILTTQTTAYPNSAQPSILNPAAVNHTFHQMNYDLGVGFMYKQTTDTFDIRVSVVGGYNNSFYPSFIRQSVNGTQEILKGVQGLYSRIKIEGTLLNPLGISLGFEAFLRAGRVPLFNVSFTKVLSIQQIGSLFGSSAK